jgi:hypothetical protein
MKYFTLHASIAVATISILAGCGGDLTHSHDIYRNEYKYKPIPVKEEEPALPPTPAGKPAGGAAPAPAPETPAAPAPAAPAPAADAPAPAGDSGGDAPAQ